MLDIRRLREAHIHVGAAFEIDAVVNAALEENRCPAGEQKQSAQGVEIFRFAHPVNIGLFEELYHADSASLP